MTKSKKLAPVYIMDILQNRTDENHVLLHNEIEDILSAEYGIELERKAVSSNINLLVEEGLIESYGKKRGCYFDDHLFDEAELNLLIYSVLGNSAIPSYQVRDMISRLEELGGPSFSSSGYSVMIQGDGEGIKKERRNEEIFDNIDKINEAIRKKCKVEFDYCKYGINRELIKLSAHTVSPYHVVMHNQRLYLVAFSDKYEELVYFRVDRMKNLALMPEKRKDSKEIPELKDIKGFSKRLSSLPYMYSDKPVKITFVADADIVDQIIDWFGTDVLIQPDAKDESRVTVLVETSPTAMEYWAKQYLDKVEVKVPTALRNRIRDSLEANLKKYAGKERRGGK